MKSAFHAAVLATLATLYLTSDGASKGATAMTKTYHMLFSGDAGARFSGRCTIETSGGETRLDLEGQVPHEQDVVGHGLSCQLQAEGRVVIDIEHGGSRTRSATNGGTITIGLR
jgi:hypothetical protein